MLRTATFYLLSTKDLEFLKQGPYAGSTIKKAVFSLIKKKVDSFARHLDSLAIEKIKYRWSGLAYAVLAVFSKEKLQVDWDKLEYNDLAEELTKKYEIGAYIFSFKDEELFKLRPNGFYYGIEELDEFAVEFQGTKPANPNVMQDSVKVLDEALSKLTEEKVLLLLIR